MLRMRTKHAERVDSTSKIVSILNQGVQVEYSMIFHYPRLISRFPDAETRKVLSRLVDDSLEHADIVADAVRELGGQPVWSIESFPEHIDLTEILQVRLEKEKLALKLYHEGTDLVPPANPLRKTFSSIARAEEFHISAVEGVLHRLKG